MQLKYYTEKPIGDISTMILYLNGLNSLNMLNIKS